MCEGVYVDSLARCTADGPGTPTTHEEWDPVPPIARWAEVRAAKGRVIDRAMEAETTLVAGLRAQGVPEREIAGLVEISPASVHRRFRGLVGAILEDLGGEREDLERVITRGRACLRCGIRDRVTVAKRRVRSSRRVVVEEVDGRLVPRVSSGWRVVDCPPRTSSCCDRCLPHDLRTIPTRVPA